MAVKLSEHTYGGHIYMRLRLDSGRIEEIDVFLRGDGLHYIYFTARQFHNNMVHLPGFAVEICTV